MYQVIKFAALALSLMLCAVPATAQQQYDAGGKARSSEYCTTTTPGDTACPANGMLAPSATIGLSNQSCTIACASTIVSGAHALYDIEASATVTGTILIYDATSCPANGTVTPKKAFAYSTANGPFSFSWGQFPMVNATGIAVCFSSTGPFTATASTTAFLSVDYK